MITSFTPFITKGTTKYDWKQKVSCKTCYKEMRSDNLARHKKQHFKKNENNIDSMIKRIMDLQKECTELSNKCPSNWISDL